MDSTSAIEDIHRAIDSLGRLTELFRQRREQLAHAVGLTEQQWLVLEEISTEHFMPSMFARARESSPAAVSKILRQLTDKELVRVSVGKDDARQRRYELTTAGRRVMRELRRKRKEAIRHVWSTLNRHKVREFAEFSEELSQRLESYVRDSQATRSDDVRTPVQNSV